MRTWKVLTPGFEGDGNTLPLTCERCETEALVPTRGVCRIEAILGTGIVYDPNTPPPPGFLPNEIQCRQCHMIYSNFGQAADVR